MVTTEERTYALNIYLKKQLSAELAQNQKKRCQEEGNYLESEHAAIICEGR